MPKNITAGIEMKIIKNLLRLPTNLVDLNLKFNSLIFETNRKLDTTKISIKTSYLKIICELNKEFQLYCPEEGHPRL